MFRAPGALTKPLNWGISGGVNGGRIYARALLGTACKPYVVADKNAARLIIVAPVEVWIAKDTIRSPRAEDAPITAMLSGYVPKGWAAAVGMISEAAMSKAPITLIAALTVMATPVSALTAHISDRRRLPALNQNRALLTIRLTSIKSQGREPQPRVPGH